MNDKKNKIINMLLIFFLLLFNVFGNIINVPVVEANNANMVTDEAFIGSMINATQGGQTRGISSNASRLGSSVIGGQRGAGRRLGTTPQRGGDNISWNPSKIDINVLYDDYTDYIINNSNPANDLVIPLNLKLERSNIDSRDAGMMHGIVINNSNASIPAPPLSNMANNYVIQLDDEYRYVHMLYNGHYMGVASSTISQSRLLYSVTTSTSWGSTYDTVRRSDAQKGSKGYDIRNRNIRFYLRKPGSMNEYTWFNVEYLVFSNSSSFTFEEIEFIHAPNNLPTRQEFISSYTNTFNVEYDTSTNQLVENNTYYTYNINDFSDNSVTINNSYVTNNYITIIESDNPNSVGEQLNYTGLFERMITAIKDLPQQIADLMPASVNEAGTNIWDVLKAIVDGIGNIGASIVDGILDNLAGLIEAILNLIFPTQEQLEESKGHLDSLIITVQEKTDFVTAPIQSFSSVYGSSRVAMFASNDNNSLYNTSDNLYNKTMVINDTEVHILPASLEPAISAFRMVSTGVIVILTMISIYTRFRGVVKH